MAGHEGFPLAFVQNVLQTTQEGFVAALQRFIQFFLNLLAAQFLAEVLTQVFHGSFKAFFADVAGAVRGYQTIGFGFECGLQFCMDGACALDGIMATFVIGLSALLTPIFVENQGSVYAGRQQMNDL